MIRKTYYKDRYRCNWKRRFQVIVGRVKAQKRKLITVTVDDLLEQLEKQEHKCFYTGALLENDVSREPLFVPSVDRIDNDKGYEVGNVAITTWAANRAKGDLSYSDFILLCRSIVKHHDMTEGREAWIEQVKREERRAEFFSSNSCAEPTESTSCVEK